MFDEREQSFLADLIGVRSWILRRIVWTVDYIYITRTGEDIVIDSIPFAEAEKITNSESTDQTKKVEAGHGVLFDKDRNGVDNKVYPTYPDNVTDLNTWGIGGTILKSATSKKALTRMATGVIGGLKAKTDEIKATLQINTIPDGFNSGCDFEFSPTTTMQCVQ
jgi:hypothetical protein